MLVCNSGAQAVGQDVPEDRNVRRRKSPESSDVQLRQPDSRQKVARRNELEKKEQSITFLRPQLMGVQKLATSELQAQRNTVEGMAVLYEREASEVDRQEVEQATDGMSRYFTAEINRL